MSRYDEIKNLVNASRNLLKGNLYENEVKSIKKSYGLLTEEDEEGVEKEYETFNNDEDDNQSDNKPEKTEKKQAYRISGGVMVIYGKSEKDLQLTTEDKSAFQESMDEFITEVSELVDFNRLNLYENNVEWSGKITEMDVEFFFVIGEKNGTYINGTMTKIDEEYLDFLVKLKKYYEKFKTKWSKVIASRKKTPTE
jgi:hypothetical protein